MTGVIYLEKKISDGFSRAMNEGTFSIEYSGAYSRFNEIFNSSKFIVVASEYSIDGHGALITTSATMSMGEDTSQILIIAAGNAISASVTKKNPDIINFTRVD